MSRNRTGSLPGGSGVNTITISVVGYSTFHPNVDGSGKSTLCNRFIRPEEDHFYKSHLKVLSDSDFKSHVVNSDHWLYWGETDRTLNEFPIHIRVIEHTEFVDDSAFRIFGQTEPYAKRCATAKLKSSEKLAYICKDQLGLEDDYEKRWFPNESVTVDGFICVYDVSRSARSIEGSSFNQSTVVFREILPQIQRTKKPVLLALTKFDQKNEDVYQDVIKTLQRKENKYFNNYVEVSALENINIDEVFLNVARLIINRRPKLSKTSYFDASQSRILYKKSVEDSFLAYLTRQLDSSPTPVEWSLFFDTRKQNEIIMRYISTYGLKSAKNSFSKLLTKKQNELKEKTCQKYLSQLLDIVPKFLANLENIKNLSTDEIITKYIPTHPSFNEYFRHSSHEDDLDFIVNSSDDDRIPLSFLYHTREARVIIEDCKANLVRDEKKNRIRHQFEDILKRSVIQPGQTLQEVELNFENESVYQSLSPTTRRKIYDNYQINLKSNALQEFTELLLERTDIFFGKSSTDEMDDIHKKLENEPRYKELVFLCNERHHAVLRFIQFLHDPSPSHCPAKSNCMDITLPKIVGVACTENVDYCSDRSRSLLSQKSRRSSMDDVSMQKTAPNSSPWLRKSDRQVGNKSVQSTVTLNILDLDKHFEELIRDHCPCNEFRTDNCTYHLKINSITCPDYLKQCLVHHKTTPKYLLGCVFVFSTKQGLSFAQNCLLKCYTGYANDYGSDEYPNDSYRTRHKLSSIGELWSRFTMVIYLPKSNSNVNCQPSASDVSKMQRITEELGCRFLQSDTYPSKNDRTLLTKIIALLTDSPRIIPNNFTPYPRNLPTLRITVTFVCGDVIDVYNLVAPLINLLSLQADSASQNTFEGSWASDVITRGTVQLRFCSFHQLMNRRKLSEVKNHPSFSSLYDCNRSRVYHPECQGYILFASSGRKASVSAMKLLTNQLSDQICKLIVCDEPMDCANLSRHARYLSLRHTTVEEQKMSYQSFLEWAWSTNTDLPLTPAPPTEDAPPNRIVATQKHSLQEQRPHIFNDSFMRHATSNSHMSNNSLTKFSLPSRHSTNSNSRTSSITDEERIYAVPNSDLKENSLLPYENCSSKSLDQNKNSYPSSGHYKVAGLEIKPKRSISGASDPGSKTHHRAWSDSGQQQDSSLPNVIASSDTESVYADPDDIFDGHQSNGSVGIKEEVVSGMVIRHAIPQNAAFCNFQGRVRDNEEGIYSEIPYNPLLGSRADSRTPFSDEDFPEHDLHSSPQSLGDRRSSHNSGDSQNYTSDKYSLFQNYRERRRSYSGPVSALQSGPVPPGYCEPGEHRVGNFSPVDHYEQINENDVTGKKGNKGMKSNRSFGNSVTPSAGNNNQPRKNSLLQRGSAMRRSIKDQFKRSTHKNQTQTSPTVAAKDEEKRLKEQSKKQKKSDKKRIQRNESSVESRSHASPERFSLDDLVEDPVTGERPALTQFVKECTQLIETRGTNLEGVYRVQGKQYDVESILNLSGQDPSGVIQAIGQQDVEVLTTLLKSTLTKYSLIPKELNDTFKEIESNSKNLNELIRRIRDELLSQVRRSRLTLISHILHHLYQLCQNHTVNKMTYYNMAICWNPTFFDITPPESMSEFQPYFNSLRHILETMIEHSQTIFPPIINSDSTNH